jgi:hypothetical protein
LLQYITNISDDHVSGGHVGDQTNMAFAHHAGEAIELW